MEQRITLDTDEEVYFYEQEFYVLSNFSSFTLMHKGLLFYTSEAAYHWEKFDDPVTKKLIHIAPSAHEAFHTAQRYKQFVRHDWEDIKCRVMLDILHDKCIQHEYVRRKLLETGDRRLVENSWRDSFWGIGPNGNGKNMLGELWMKVRASLRNEPYFKDVV